MGELLFPNWTLFSGIFLFLKVYEPTRLYLHNTCCLAIAIACAMFIDHSQSFIFFKFGWVITVVIFAFFMSIPYWLGGMVGSVIQQLLLLNEQSVQDSRFTDESESLAKMSSLIFVYYALADGMVFKPLVELITSPTSITLDIDFEGFFFLVVDSLRMLVIVSGKYIVIMLSVTVCCGYVDLFFKKASLSQFVTPNIKAVLVIILLNIWFLNDQFYVFRQLMKKVGYE